MQYRILQTHNLFIDSRKRCANQNQSVEGSAYFPTPPPKMTLKKEHHIPMQSFGCVPQLVTKSTMYLISCKKYFQNFVPRKTYCHFYQQVLEQDSCSDNLFNILWFCGNRILKILNQLTIMPTVFLLFCGLSTN